MAQYALSVSQSSCEVNCHGAQWSIVLCQFSASSQDPSETDSFRVRVAPYGYAFISDGQLIFGFDSIEFNAWFDLCLRPSRHQGSEKVVWTASFQRGFAK